MADVAGVFGIWVFSPFKNDIIFSNVPLMDTLESSGKNAIFGFDCLDSFANHLVSAELRQHEASSSVWDDERSVISL